MSTDRITKKAAKARAKGQTILAQEIAARPKALAAHIAAVEAGGWRLEHTGVPKLRFGHTSRVTALTFRAVDQPTPTRPDPSAGGM